MGVDITARGLALRPTAKAFSQSALPLIIVSGGSMGNNGALTVTNTLFTAHPNAYVYLPAGAISGGSAAGWYYAVFASTTTATVYNNNYTPGTIPTIPSVPAPFVTTGSGAYTQTTAEITFDTVTIPGGTIGKRGQLELVTLMSYGASANNKILRVKLGSATFLSSFNTSVASQQVYTRLANRDSQAVQVGFYNTHAAGFTPNANANFAAAVDTSADVVLSITGQIAASTDTMTRESYVHKIFAKG
jgi:hypothetical protein